MRQCVHCGRGWLGMCPPCPSPVCPLALSAQHLGLGVCVLPLEPEPLLWVDNNSNRNPS